MSGGVSDWRSLGGVLTAWFDSPSLLEAAALARRVIAGASPPAEIAVDVRPSGVRVRVGSPEQAEAVSAAARSLGSRANPSALQQVRVVVESPGPSEIGSFWQQVLGYAAALDGGGLVDPWRRDPDLDVRRSVAARPLRGRVHLDVVRPEAVVAQVRPGQGGGPYGVRHADPDGNEVDLVPGSALGEGDDTSDWQVVWGAMVGYRTTSVRQQGDLVGAAAALADDAGFPLLIDVRPGLVVLDTGKDLVDADAHGLPLDFAVLARDLQRAARDLGVTADPALPRLVQLFLDAADVDAVRAFWAAALGYRPDARVGLTDLDDPRRLNPVLVFQALDLTETDRRRQSNPLHLELAVPADSVPARLRDALAAGGRLLEETTDRYCVADPEGNVLVLVTT